MASAQALTWFLLDINRLETTMENLAIHKMVLWMQGPKWANPGYYRWVSEHEPAKHIMKQLSNYPFLHSDKVIPLTRFETTGYTRNYLVCCIFIFSVLTLCSFHDSCVCLLSLSVLATWSSFNVFSNCPETCLRWAKCGSMQTPRPLAL
jgi:hypothetical protein